MKIQLVETGFSMIPEGKHTFKVTEVNYDSTFGKLEVHLVTQDGRKHTERFGLLNKKGEANEGAIKAFSFFAKTVLNDFALEEIDHEELVGYYIKARVEHVESDAISEKTGKPFVNVRLQDTVATDGFGGDSDDQEPLDDDDNGDDDDDWDI